MFNGGAGDADAWRGTRCRRQRWSGALVDTLLEERERHKKQRGQQELQHLHKLLERELPLRSGKMGDEYAEVAWSPHRSCAHPAKAVMFDTPMSTVATATSSDATVTSMT